MQLLHIWFKKALCQNNLEFFVMSHKRQDTYCKTSEWAKHLRPFGKRKQAGKERKEAKKRIRKDSDNLLGQ